MLVNPALNFFYFLQFSQVYIFKCEEELKISWDVLGFHLVPFSTF